MKLKTYFQQLKRFYISGKKFRRFSTKILYEYNQKLFKSYLIHGLFSNNFTITFGSCYRKNFATWKRDWFDYFVCLGTYSYNTMRYDYKFLKPAKPINIKFRIPVNEDMLNMVVTENKLCIVQEHLSLKSSSYVISAENLPTTLC